MSFFKSKTINWKYIIGEILLLFVGINLAIWFNDWNNSKVVERDKEIALDKIEGEIKANLEELVENGAQNQKIPAFYREINRLTRNQKNKLTQRAEIEKLMQEFPEFVKKLDSTSLGNGEYEYHMDTFINLELTDLSSIAWEISKTTGIFHEFGYDCLYELQSLYNTQDLVKNELGNATDALRDQSIEGLLRILDVLRQLEAQLETQYKSALENMPNCR